MKRAYGDRICAITCIENYLFVPPLAQNLIIEFPAIYIVLTYYIPARQLNYIHIPDFCQNFKTSILIEYLMNNVN